MRYTKWLGLFAAILMVITCFIPWLTLDVRNIVISGVKAEGTNYGKPGYMSLVLTAIFIILHFIPRVWAKRGNLAVVALGLGWAIRNFFVLSTCQAGECPDRKAGIFLQLLAAALMLIAALFPDMKVQPKKTA